MAQILKESVRHSIVESAIEELLNNGYEKSSMRKIALNAKMTVGNLYRYFKNKDEMVQFIIMPVLNKIDIKIRELTEESVSLKDASFDFSKLDDDKIIYALDKISDELVDLYKKYPKVMRIIMMDSKYNENLQKWCSKLIYQLFDNRNKIEDVKKYELLSKMHTSSMFAAVRECLNHSELNEKETSEAIRLYFHSFLTGLERR